MIEDLIERNKIDIHFQPIVSIKDKKIIAFEALTRAYDHNDELISPLFLFEQANKENYSWQLDCYVRTKAIKKFKQYYEEDDSILLFLNFESSMINEEISDNFLDVVKECNINPLNIVIEIKEESVKETRLLQKFVEKYKKEGFIIALDDFGAGYSSFDRLALIKPRIVKIDRSIIYNIQNNFINSEILSSIANMCHNIGAIVLAEGVESKDEILSCMQKDIDLFQGFYFCRPKEHIDASIVDTTKKEIDLIGQGYKDIIQSHIDKKCTLLDKAKNILEKTLGILQDCESAYLKKLNDILHNEDNLEAIYILNIDGVQVGDTIIADSHQKLFSPTKSGHDHSLKEYFFIAKGSSRGDYLSNRYISKASGNFCNTYSSKISFNDKSYIACFDIIA